MEPEDITQIKSSVAKTLGRLESMKVRDFWADEARDFTPWLAQEENLDLLGEAIEMSLKLEGTELSVGPFKADVVARDGEDRLVIIENQLGATDHKHLGQLLVYAAGRSAHTVVWVAKQVTDEYRKVLDWLNEETNVSFYALEVELWRIGDSLPAPKFNIVCEPNELTKPPPDSAAITETKLLQLEFWKAFSEYAEASATGFAMQKPKPQHWYDLRLGTSRAHVSLTALAKGRIGCELYIGHSQADLVFKVLDEARDEIEAQLGKLEWQPLPEKKSCRIARYREAEIEDRNSWPELFKWLLHEAENFRLTFAARVKAIHLPDATKTTIATPDASTQLPSPQPGPE